MQFGHNPWGSFGKVKLRCSWQKKGRLCICIYMKFWNQFLQGLIIGGGGHFESRPEEEMTVGQRDECNTYYVWQYTMCGAQRWASPTLMRFHTMQEKSYKCGRCHACPIIFEAKQFCSTNTSKKYQIKHHLNCASSFVIYLATCKKCSGKKTLL